MWKYLLKKFYFSSYCIIIVTCSPFENDQYTSLYFDSICNVTEKVKSIFYELVTKLCCENKEIKITASVRNSSIFMESLSFTKT